VLWRPPNNHRVSRHFLRPRKKRPKLFSRLVNVGLTIIHAIFPQLVAIDRVQKLKDARTEAGKEIEGYKKAKEQEFKSFESSVRFMISLRL
jgi:hypothetical protein